MAPRFLVAPLLGSPVLGLISRSSSFDWHIQQIIATSKTLNDLKTFWDGSDDIRKLMLGLIGVIIANQSSL